MGTQETQAQLDKRHSDYKAKLTKNIRDCIVGAAFLTVQETLEARVPKPAKPLSLQETAKTLTVHQAAKAYVTCDALIDIARECIYNEYFCDGHAEIANPAYLTALDSLINEVYSMTVDLSNPD